MLVQELPRGTKRGSVGPQRVRKERGSWTGVSQLSQSWEDIDRGGSRSREEGWGLR